VGNNLEIFNCVGPNNCVGRIYKKCYKFVGNF
jgi:hypothetical protein